MNSAMPPLFLTAAATSLPRAWSGREHDPCTLLRKEMGAASPIPEAAPVMTITLSLRFIGVLRGLDCPAGSSRCAQLACMRGTGTAG